MAIKTIQVRRDTSTNWASTNPILALGEAGYETNTGKLKYGDGATAWTGLAYFSPQDLSGLVPNTRTVNGHALSSNVTVSQSDVGLGNVTNDAQLKIASNLSEINTADNRGSARYNLRTPTLFNAVNVYISNVSSLSGSAAASDGVTPSNGDVVLLVAQTTASQNGPWVVNTGGAWTRPTDFPNGGTIRSRFIQVASGTLFGGSVWGLAASSTITIDTTSQTWKQIAKPAGLFPKVAPRSGQYYSQSGQTNAATSPLAGAGSFMAHPVHLMRGTYDRIAVSSTVAAVSTYRLGIYRALTEAESDTQYGFPFGLAPLLDAGTVNMNNTAGVQAITINQFLDEGIYWLAVLCDSYTAQPTIHTCNYGSNTQPQIFGLSVNSSSLGRFNLGLQYGTTMTPGALATFPTSSISESGVVPRIMVRAA